MLTHLMFFLEAFPFSLFSVCMGGVWNCTETNCSGLSSPSEHLLVEDGKSGDRLITVLPCCLPQLSSGVFGDR